LNESQGAIDGPGHGDYVPAGIRDRSHKPVGDVHLIFQNQNASAGQDMVPSMQLRRAYHLEFPL